MNTCDLIFHCTSPAIPELEEFLYAFHSGIEALAGSMLVIRGRGAMDTLQAWVGATNGHRVLLALAIVSSSFIVYSIYI